jgi:hypothetical protein
LLPLPFQETLKAISVADSTIGDMCVPFDEIQSAYNRATIYRIQKLVTMGFVVCLFTFHPTITKQLIRMFACAEVTPDQFFMRQDMRVQCYEPDWKVWAFGVGFTGIVLFSCGCPLGMAKYIHTQKKEALKMQLCQKSTEQKFIAAQVSCASAICLDAIGGLIWCFVQWCFMLDGYTPKCVYWEFYIFLRKTTIVIATFAFTGLGLRGQVYIILLILVICLITHIKAQPYEHTDFIDMNYLEANSLACVILTLLLGMFYKDSVTDFGHNISVYLILFVNAWTLLSFLASAMNYCVKLPQGLNQVSPRLVSDESLVMYQKIQQALNLRLRVFTMPPFSSGFSLHKAQVFLSNSVMPAQNSTRPPEPTVASSPGTPPRAVLPPLRRAASVEETSNVRSLESSQGPPLGPPYPLRPIKVATMAAS